MPLGSKKYSNSALKKGDIYNEAMKSGARGLPFLKVLDNGKEITSFSSKFFSFSNIVI